MNFDLPPTGTEQPPLFVDLPQCEAWRAKLPLTNPVQAQAQLLRQLHLLNRYTVAADVRLSLLEALREPIRFVQEESAKKFAGKPLPLAPPEQAALDSTHSLWDAQWQAYLRCVAACFESPQPFAALACQRALAAQVDDYLDQVRAGQLPRVGHWQGLHRSLAAAEALGVTNAVVEDGLRASHPVSPVATYAEGILLSAASLHELTPRQQGWVAGWARRWGGKITLHATPPAIESRALPLCVDLASDAPASYKPLPGATVRFLDTTALRKSLKARIERLAKGDPEDTPARLGLGESCVQPACGELLRRIYPRWVKGGVLRRAERQTQKNAGCRFVVGVDAIHYYVSGRQAFKSPGGASAEELRRQREELATFGRVADRFMDEYSRNHGYQLENWEIDEDWGIQDQSASGLRLVRPLKQPGGRLSVGQLVAVQLANASGLTLGMVRWAQVSDSLLLTGIQLFPGKPYPVAVRGTGVMAAREPYRPGFLLPAIAALNQPASIVLPPASFKPERIVEASADGGSGEYKLKALLDRGADFERAACEEMPRKP